MVSLLALTGSRMLAQNRKQVQQRTLDIDCIYEYYIKTRQAVDSGQFSKVDSIYVSYLESPCYRNRPKKKSYYDKPFLELLLAQRLADGYRSNEAELFRKMIDSLEVRVKEEEVNFGIYRIGIAGGMDISSLGKAGKTYGVKLGYHPGVDGYSSFSIDVGLYLQDLPFSVNIVNNKGADNNYTPTGYLLKAHGRISSTNLQVLGGINFEPSEIGGVGIGLFGGFGWNHFSKVKVDKSYYEHNYAYTPGPTPNLTFSIIDSADYIDNKFFKNRNYLCVIGGGTFYYMPLKNILLSLETSFNINVGKRMRFSMTETGHRYNYWGTKLGVSVLFGRKRKATL